MRSGLAVAILLFGLVANAGAGGSMARPEEEAPPSESVTLRYEVSWSLLTLLEIQSRTRMLPEGYAMAVEMETVGLVDLLFPWRASQQATGTIEDRAPTPRSFRAASEFRGRRQEIDLGYGPGGLDRERVEGSTVDPAQRVEVPAEMRRDTVDPLSAALSVSQRLASQGTCTGISRIFDGVRRYDLDYEDLGETSLEDGRFRGPARLCRARMIPLGGFWQPPDREPDSLERIDAWFAPPWPGADPVPVRIALEGTRGTLDVRLVSAAREGEPSRGS